VSDAAALYLPEVSRWHGDSHVTAFCERRLALRGAIGEIVRLEIGREELHDVRSCDVVLMMEFASVAALRLYQRHPQHLAVMAFNEPFVANVASVDFTRPYEGSPMPPS
jgi:stress responsive alpha/beta barrel protein